MKQKLEFGSPVFFIHEWIFKIFITFSAEHKKNDKMFNIWLVLLILAEIFCALVTSVYADIQLKKRDFVINKSGKSR